MSLPDLQAGVEREAAAFSGRLAVAARRLDRGLEFARRADEVFPAASIIKLPILLEALRQVEAGRLSLADRLHLRAGERVGGSGVLHALEPGLEPTLRDLLSLMIVVSDNTATNLVYDAVGGRGAVNATLEGWGLRATRSVGKLQLPPELRNEDQKAGRVSETSPGEALWLLEHLWRGALLGPEATRLALEILEGQQHTEMLARLLPEGTRVASKSGAIEGVRHDVGIVSSGNTVYAVALMSAGCADRRYHVDNEAVLALARVSSLVFDAMTAG